MSCADKDPDTIVNETQIDGDDGIDDVASAESSSKCEMTANEQDTVGENAGKNNISLSQEENTNSESEQVTRKFSYDEVCEIEGRSGGFVQHGNSLYYYSEDDEEDDDAIPGMVDDLELFGSQEEGDDGAMENARSSNDPDPFNSQDQEAHNSTGISELFNVQENFSSSLPRDEFAPTVVRNDVESERYLDEIGECMDDFVKKKPQLDESLESLSVDSGQTVDIKHPTGLLSDDPALYKLKPGRICYVSRNELSKMEGKIEEVQKMIQLGRELKDLVSLSEHDTPGYLRHDRGEGACGGRLFFSFMLKCLAFVVPGVAAALIARYVLSRTCK